MSEHKHFKLTKEVKIFDGITLYRIQATKDLPNGVKKGDLGGYVEKLENLDGNAWVYGDARVYGDAWVSGNVRVYGNAKVSSRTELLFITTRQFTITITPQNISIGCELFERKGKNTFLKLYKTVAKKHNISKEDVEMFKDAIKFGLKHVKGEKNLSNLKGD